jgi:hypothetical protein
MCSHPKSSSQQVTTWPPHTPHGRFPPAAGLPMPQLRPKLHAVAPPALSCSSTPPPYLASSRRAARNRSALAFFPKVATAARSATRTASSASTTPSYLAPPSGAPSMPSIPRPPSYIATPTTLSHTMPKKGSCISVLLLYIGQSGITRTRSRIIGYPKCRVLKNLDKFRV